MAEAAVLARFAANELPGGGGGIFLNPAAADDPGGGGGGAFLRPEPDDPEAVEAFVVALDKPLAPVSCLFAILIAAESQTSNQDGKESTHLYLQLAY